MARTVQVPDQPGEVAIVFRGKPGTGKGFFANHFGKLFGRHYLPIRDSNHIFGRFTQHLQECVVLFADEAFWCGSKKQEGMLKSLITENTVMAEGKGTNAVIVPNFIHIIMASNEDWVVPVGNFDRRFFVLDVGDDQRRNRDYFGGIIAQLENGGYEALLHYLLNYNLKDYDVTDVPITAAHHDQKVFTMDGQQEWWYQKLQDGRVFEHHDEWAERVWAIELCNDFIEYTSRWDRTQTSNASKMGRFLRSALPAGYDRKQASGQHTVRQRSGEMLHMTRPYFYQLPSLQEARDSWDKAFGVADWGDPIESIEIPEHEETNF
jgi:hypothetical protein